MVFRTLDYAFAFCSGLDESKGDLWSKGNFGAVLPGIGTSSNLNAVFSTSIEDDVQHVLCFGSLSRWTVQVWDLSLSQSIES